MNLDFGAFASFAHLADDGRSRPEELLAPAPQLDRFPIVIGANLTGAYLSAAFRLCVNGYRYQFVDVLNELLEHDPHARGVVRQRLLSIAGARIELDAADVPTDDPEAELAKTIRDECWAQLQRIPRRSQAFAALLWGIIYGVSAAEIGWERTSLWTASSLNFIHSRRLSYPDPNNWDLFVWDQGALSLLPQGRGSTTGLRIADYPNKFIVHAPQLNGDYATRDGEGRYIAFYMLLKRTIVRATAQDFERTIRPWVLAYFNRLDPKSANSAASQELASKEDIAQADLAVRALGMGGLNGAVLPNTVKVELLKAASALNAQQFVEWLDAQVSKGLLGQTFTTDTGKFGSRSTADVGRTGSKVIARYDGQCFADSVEGDLVGAIVRLNWPDKLHLMPRVRVVTDEEPNPLDVMALAKDATSIDMPVDAVKVSQLTGVPLIDEDDPKAIRTRMVSAGHGPTPGDPNDPEPDNGEGGDGTEDPNEPPAAPLDEEKDAAPRPN